MGRMTPTRTGRMAASLLGVVAASLTVVFAAAPSPQSAPAAPARVADSEAPLATLKQYCATCHSDRTKTGGVSFEGITAGNIGQHAEVFEKAVRKMRGRVMPPPGARQPDAATAEALIAWLENTLDQTTSRAHVPDRVILHRLNRKEYTNAVRDLL